MRVKRVIRRKDLENVIKHNSFIFKKIQLKLCNLKYVILKIIFYNINQKLRQISVIIEIILLGNAYFNDKLIFKQSYPNNQRYINTNYL